MYENEYYYVSQLFESNWQPRVMPDEQPLSHRREPEAATSMDNYSAPNVSLHSTHQEAPLGPHSLVSYWWSECGQDQNSIALFNYLLRDMTRPRDAMEAEAYDKEQEDLTKTLTARLNLYNLSKRLSLLFLGTETLACPLRMSVPPSLVLT